MNTLGIPAVSSSSSADDIHALMKEYGAVRILNLVDDSVMDRVEAELETAVANTALPNAGDAGAEILGLSTKRICRLIARSRTCGELAIHPLVLQVLDRGLELYQLQVSQAICLMPGEKAQCLHRDDMVYPEVRHPLDKELVINVIWAVREFTEELGGTRAIPGSHRWDDQREPREAETVCTVMPRGSALIYFGSLWHGGGANRTRDQIRYAVSMAYSRHWLRQEENQFLVAPPHIARNLPERLQQLIGYQGSPPYLGWYDLKDPMDLLKSGELQ